MANPRRQFEPGKLLGKYIFIEELPTKFNGVRVGMFLCPCGDNFESPLEAKRQKRHGCPKCSLKFLKDVATVHGEGDRNRTKEYRTWTRIKGRCYDKKLACYPNYGGRGIKVCERWSGADGYINFLNDMGRMPSPKHSIDRINHNGDYSPENCRWATSTEQNRNKRNTIIFLDKNTGVYYISMVEASEFTGESRHTLNKVKNNIETHPYLIAV